MNVIRPKRGEVWYVDLNPTRGREQAKKRPCIIVSVDFFNRSQSGLAIAVPLTSKLRKSEDYVKILPPEGGLVAPSHVLCEQIRSLALERFSNHPVGEVKESTMLAIEYTIKVLLGFK